MNNVPRGGRRSRGHHETNGECEVRIAQSGLQIENDVRGGVDRVDERRRVKFGRRVDWQDDTS